jgi:hypothetical protein
MSAPDASRACAIIHYNVGASGQSRLLESVMASLELWNSSDLCWN